MNLSCRALLSAKCFQDSRALHIIFWGQTCEAFPPTLPAAVRAATQASAAGRAVRTAALPGAAGDRGDRSHYRWGQVWAPLTRVTGEKSHRQRGRQPPPHAEDCPQCSSRRQPSGSSGGKAHKKGLVEGRPQPGSGGAPPPLATTLPQPRPLPRAGE